MAINMTLSAPDSVTIPAMRHFLDIILTRRSIRRYEKRPVPPALVEQILTAAAWSPSAHNRQPWRFVIIADLAVKERLAIAMGDRLRHDLSTDGLPPETIEKDAGRSYTRITGAPLLVLVCLTMADMDIYSDERRQLNELTMAIQSTAMAGQNLLLAAHALGLGACWLCAPLFCADVVSRVLDLPGEWQPQGLITVGYPAEEKEKTRHPLGTRVVYR